jgi:hypothetical protein
MFAKLTPAWLGLLGVCVSIAVLGQTRPSPPLVRPTTAQRSAVVSPPVCSARLIKRAVLSSKYVYDHLPEKAAPLDKELYHRIFDLVDVAQSLLYEFDNLNADEDLRVLATLVCFDLGEHPSEVLQCVVLRKGERILPYLEELQTKPSLKDAVAHDLQCDWNAKDDARAHETIRAMIQKIRNKDTCPSLEM